MDTTHTVPSLRFPETEAMMTTQSLYSLVPSWGMPQN
jgi:hypothetical protein